jgi:hypothetical protein
MFNPWSLDSLGMVETWTTALSQVHQQSEGERRPRLRGRAWILVADCDAFEGQLPLHLNGRALEMAIQVVFHKPKSCKDCNALETWRRHESWLKGFLGVKIVKWWRWFSLPLGEGHSQRKYFMGAIDSNRPDIDPHQRIRNDASWLEVCQPLVLTLIISPWLVESLNFFPIFHHSLVQSTITFAVPTVQVALPR